jgi:hypothetical protein
LYIPRSVRSPAEPQAYDSAILSEVVSDLSLRAGKLQMKQYLQSVTQENKNLHEMVNFAIKDMHQVVVDRVDPVMQAARNCKELQSAWNERVCPRIGEMEKAVIAITQPEDATRMGITLQVARRSAIFNKLYR